MQRELALPERHHGQLERVLILRSFPGLAHLEPSELAVIAEHADERFYPAGKLIYREGEPVKELHYILEGRVCVKRNGIVINELGGLSVVGGLASLASVDDGYEVVAMEDTTTLAMNKEDQADVFEDNFEMLLAVIRAVATAMVEMRKAMGPGGGVDTGEDGVPPPPPRLKVVDRLNYLHRNMSMGQARLEAIAELARESTEFRAKKGDVLFRTGDPSEFGYFIVSGIVRSADDHALRFGPGDGVGTLDSMAGKPRWFTAECETDIVAIEIETEVFLDVLEDNVDLAMVVLQNMADVVLTLREQVARAND